MAKKSGNAKRKKSAAAKKAQKSQTRAKVQKKAAAKKAPAAKNTARTGTRKRARKPPSPKAPSAAKGRQASKSKLSPADRAHAVDTFSTRGSSGQESRRAAQEPVSLNIDNATRDRTGQEFIPVQRQ